MTDVEAVALQGATVVIEKDIENDQEWTLGKTGELGETTMDDEHGPLYPVDVGRGQIVYVYAAEVSLQDGVRLYVPDNTPEQIADVNYGGFMLEEQYTDAVIENGRLVLRRKEYVLTMFTGEGIPTAAVLIEPETRRPYVLVTQEHARQIEAVWRGEGRICDETKGETHGQ